jgi:hypothetical protein
MMQDRSVLIMGMVALVACIVSLIPAVAQKDATQAPGAPQLPPTAPVTASGSTSPTPPAADLVFLSSDPVMINVDPKLDDDTVIGVSLQNKSTTKSYVPAAALKEFGFGSESGEAVQTKTVLSLEGVPMQAMAPGDTAHLLLRWKKESKVRPGTYDGMLVITADSKDTRRSIQVVIPDVTATIQPQVTKLNVRLYRIFPFIGDFFAPTGSFAPAIPLQTALNTNRVGLTRRHVLTVLTRDPVGTVPVCWDMSEGDCTVADVSKQGPHAPDQDGASRQDPDTKNPAPPRDITKLGLKFGNIPFAGKYDGTLNFGNDKAAVTVSLTATDLFVYPLVVLIVSVWVAIRGKDFLGGGRQILQWRADVAAARDAMRQARGQFDKEFSGSAYSIQNDFDAQARTILDDISILKGNFSGTLDLSNPLFTFVNTEIPVLAATAKSWVLFGKQLEALRDARAAIPTFPLPRGIEDPAAIVTQADTLLTGKDVLITDLAGLETQVVDQTSFIAQWTGLAKTVDKIRSGLNDVLVPQANAQKAAALQQTIDDLNQQVVDAFSALWDVTGQDVDKNKAVVDTVTTLKGKFVDLLNDKALQPGLAAGKPEAVQPKAVLEAFSLMADTRPVESDWKSETSAEDFLKEISRRDKALGRLSYVLALLTGLTTLYFGKNFGTVNDYFLLILWAFGSKITVDVLSGGLERFVASQG